MLFLHSYGVEGRTVQHISLLLLALIVLIDQSEGLYIAIGK